MQAQSVMYQRQCRARGSIAGTLARLVALTLGFTSLALILAWLSGPPRLPTTMPNAERIHQLLTGADLPAADIAYLASSLAWAILVYLIFSAALRSIVLVLLWWGGATRAALRLVWLTDLLTAPPIRRLTDGAVAAVMMTSACLVPPVKVRAAVTASGPALQKASFTMASAYSEPEHILTVDLVEGRDATFTLQAQSTVLAAPYTVAAGDTLWQIAERFYGDGHRYTDIVAANIGRVMVTGEHFDGSGLIRPGWVLLVPLPAANVEAEGAELTYRIQPGDSLWRIAARFLGDGRRWPEIWDLNQHRDMGGGRTFASPGLLVPGWTLRLSAAPTITAPEASPPVAEPPVAMPTVVAPDAQPTPPSGQQPISSPSVTPTVPPVREAPTPQEGNGRWSSDQLLLAAGAAGLAATGAALVLGRRTRGSAQGRGIEERRQHGPWGRPPRRVIPLGGDVTRVQLAARLLLAALQELGFDGVRVLTCRESAEVIAMLVACPPGDVEAVVSARYALARRLGCPTDARVLAGYHVEITLSHLRREAAALTPSDERDRHALLLCPVGADTNSVLYLNIAGLDSIQVVGTDAETAGLLQGWLMTLAASVPSSAYAVVLPPEFLDRPSVRRDLAIPRWAPGGQDIDDPLTAAATELAARLAGDVAAGRPLSLVAVVPVGAVQDTGQLETLVRRGRALGIHMVALGGRNEEEASGPSSAAADDV